MSPGHKAMYTLFASNSTCVRENSRSLFCQNDSGCARSNQKIASIIVRKKTAPFLPNQGETRCRPGL